MRRVLISGSHGLLGRAIAEALRAAGDEVIRLGRSESSRGEPTWMLEGQPLGPGNASGFDAVIHLAGEPVAGRWTAAKKRAIADSRIRGTASLVAALAEAEQPPQQFLCASGINYYGEGGDLVQTEAAPAGPGFLSQVCIGWEAAAAALAPKSRVVSMRIGVVLDTAGGTLAAMLPIFRIGLGGHFTGDGLFVSWITLTDLVRSVIHLLHDSSLAGPVNCVAPQPVPNRNFTRTLASALGRPAVLPAPRWAIRLVLGEFAKETILSSVRAVPARLLEAGFRFEQPTLEDAFASLRLRAPE